MGRLYLVSTPIGNLQDITLRAIEVLSKVDIIACEDTRKTSFLVNKVRPRTRTDLAEGKPQFLSYFEQNELAQIPQIIQFLKEGKNVALVSNAGTPTISDPGFKLVRECIQQGIKVEAIPGTSAILAALTSSGLPTNKFLFLGYLPKKEGKKKKLLENLQTMKQSNNLATNNLTIIFFESPHRLQKTLQELKEVFGDIDIVICRELTKIHEEIRREKVSEAIKHFEQIKPKGEFTILLHPEMA